MTSEKAAKLISLISGPFMWIPVLFLIVLANANLTVDQAKVLVPTIFILDVVIPILYLALAPRLGWVKSWEMNNRLKRTPFYSLVVVMTFITLVVVYLAGSMILFAYNLIFVALVSLYLIINLKWKISGHAAMNAVGVLVIATIYGWEYLMLAVLILPPVYWSRMKLERHSIWQLLAGTGVTILVFVLGVMLFTQLGFIV